MILGTWNIAPLCLAEQERASSVGSDPNDKTGYFFKPQTSSELEDAFKDIAKQLGKLRLTQ